MYSVDRRFDSAKYRRPLVTRRSIVFRTVDVRDRFIALHLLYVLPSFWYWSDVGYSPFLRDFGLRPRSVEDERQQGDGDRAQMVQEPWMDFVWSCCFGRIYITKGCFDHVYYEALIYLWMHHLILQPTIKRIYHFSLVHLKLEIAHISVNYYKAAFCFCLT